MNCVSSSVRSAGYISPVYDEDGELWCPFHTYRTSGDARPTYGSLLRNLTATTPFAAAFDIVATL